jgi:hypothetical protein
MKVVQQGLWPTIDIEASWRHTEVLLNDPETKKGGVVPIGDDPIYHMGWVYQLIQEINGSLKQWCSCVDTKSVQKKA